MVVASGMELSAALRSLAFNGPLIGDAGRL